MDPKHYQRIVLDLHGRFVRALEWSGLQALPEDTQLLATVREFCDAECAHLAATEREQIARSILAETIGLGPLESLLADPEVSDVLVNGPEEVFIEKRGKLERADARFADTDHLLRIIQRVAGRVGRRIDESQPMVDARLPDGSRVHALIAPLAIRGPTLSIRRFGKEPLAISQLVHRGSLTQPMADFLADAVEKRVSMLISGGTGAGKTTLLNAISAFIPADERIVTIEDSAELNLRHDHVVSLETRTSNSEGSGEVSIRELLRNSLRMRPDRILVGEVRSVEVIDMLQAMNTGHPGSMSTIHANDTKDALSRLEMMIGMSGYEFPIDVLRRYIASGIRLLVHVERFETGMRRVTRISEIAGVREQRYRIRDVYRFQSGDHSEGSFEATGYIPPFYRRRRLAVPAAPPFDPTPAPNASLGATPFPIRLAPEVARRFSIASVTIEQVPEPVVDSLARNLVTAERIDASDESATRDVTLDEEV
jgi:pilus assembly protein CpaF